MLTLRQVMEAVTAEHEQNTNYPHSLLTGALLGMGLVHNHEHMFRNTALFHGDEHYGTWVICAEACAIPGIAVG